MHDGARTYVARYNLDWTHFFLAYEDASIKLYIYVRIYIHMYIYCKCSWCLDLG